jgi:hypothetical protein
MTAPKLAAAMVVLVLGFIGEPGTIPAAHAEPAPTRCRDLPGTFGNSHVCQFPDGSVTNCISSALPVVGPPCTPIYTQLTPGFWDQS